jgi:hypothetical protein
VAVTGAAGVLGSTVVERLLADGHQVHGIDLVPARHDAHPRMHHRPGDIRDRTLVASARDDADAVVHLRRGIAQRYRPDLIRSAIVDGTSVVLSEAARAAVPGWCTSPPPPCTACPPRCPPRRSTHGDRSTRTRTVALRRHLEALHAFVDADHDLRTLVRPLEGVLAGSKQPPTSFWLRTRARTGVNRPVARS